MHKSVKNGLVQLGLWGFDDTHYKLRGKERAKFKKMPNEFLSAVPDMLTVNDVIEFTEYNRSTILRYIRKNTYMP